MAIHVVKNDGFLALYNGLSASLCRQVCVRGHVTLSEHFRCWDEAVAMTIQPVCQMCAVRRSSLISLRRNCELIVVLPSLSSHLLPSPQMSYSLTRFAIYETVRDMMGSKNQGPMPFYQKVMLGAFGGGETHTCPHTQCVTQPQKLSQTL